jgi:hypothetical protein
MTFADAKRFEDKTVVLKCTDGELISGKISFVDEEYQDLIIDVTYTSKPDKWTSGHSDPACVYTITLEEIASIEAAE